MKAFLIDVVLRILRNKSTTNAANFIKFGDHFYLHVWDTEGPPMQKVDF